MDRDGRFAAAVDGLLRCDGARLRALEPQLARVDLGDREVWVLSANFGDADRIADRLRALVDHRTHRRTTLLVVGGAQAEQQAVASALPAFAWGRPVEAIAIADDGGVFGEPASAARSAIARAAACRAEVTLDELRARLDTSPEPAALPWMAGIGDARVTQAIVVAWSVLLVLEHVFGGASQLPTLVRMGGITEATLRGEPWRLLASSWLHNGVAHLMSNALLLLLVGPLLERYLGGARMLLVHGAAVLAGALASTAHAPMIVGVGGSGGVLGIVAATVLMLAAPGDLVPAAELRAARRRLLTLGLALWVVPAILWRLVMHALGGPLFVLGHDIDHPLHLAGAVAGAIAWMLLRGTPASLGPRLRIAARVVVAAHVVCVAGAIAMGRPWERGVEIDGVVTIVEPSPPVHHRLAGMRASITLPAELGAPTLEQNEGSTTYAFGNTPTSPFWIAITHTPIDPPLSGAELRATFDESLAIHDPAMPSSPRQEERGARWPTSVERVSTPTTELMTRSELRHDGWIVIEAEFPRDARMRRVVDEAIASLRVDGD